MLDEAGLEMRAEIGLIGEEILDAVGGELIAVDDDVGERRGKAGSDAGSGGQSGLRLSDADVAIVAGIAALVAEREVRAEVVLDAEGGDVVAGPEIVAAVIEAVVVVARDRRGTVEEPRDAVVGNVVGLLIEAADDDAGGRCRGRRKETARCRSGGCSPPDVRRRRLHRPSD